MDDMTEIKTTLGHIVGLLARLDARFDRLDAAQSDLKAEVAELRGEMRGELRQLGQRISDVNARLPVPIAYQPPDKRTA